ncbi:tetratricopeptide repeat protein [Chromohalobacter sp. 11-W]|uniref:tetratricopeptide repeat protein n=1 Tax=Chromohalobacter sp. 11-W TaxID=2994061 RepID=UPI00246991FF|nr:tetratricopeptide repeat protein [Chromohalobacter sp. 11-W]
MFTDPTGDDLNSSYEKIGRTKLESQVKEGEPSAEYMMGMIYLSGDDRWGIDSNKKKALSLLENAWEAGVMDAGYTLSTMYYKGQSVDKNFCKVRNLLLKSGEGGYIKSQRALGRAYKGEVLQDVFNKNIEQSISWFKKAAKNGDQLSAASLSVIYRDGDGVKRNDKLSFEWKKKQPQLSTETLA